ncbi:transcriptional regulator [Vibrio sp. B1FLJ16]|uniref:helix-turn-helix domain-containing protein n=1 Tax=Vibrio sp. B1FLJ16 TaxID=2751178 RepID=UPI0015F70487|nr:helix-turn-helix transcriptional regulator [Vibrio sp. B1FLJ16]CAD7822174.1 transcriptional regulator [Vibrio sp. B1FLJ16]CAE6948293.1 transcriptional regulator [Vibrio sp. B1FLJ16]
MNGNVSNVLTSAMLEHLSTLGRNTDELIKKCGINKHVLSKKYGRISSSSHYALLEEFMPYQKLFFKDSGLDGMYSMFPELFSLCINESSAKSAIESFIENRALIGTCDQCEVQINNDTMKITYKDTGPNKMISSALSNFVFIQEIIHQYIPNGKYSVSLTHTNYVPHHAVNEKLNTKCLFGQSENYLIVKSSTLTERNNLFNENLYKLQKNNLNKIKKELSNNKFSHIVEDMVILFVSDNEFFCDQKTLEKVCKKLRMSRWTLNKKLGEENKRFTDIFNKVRLDKAVKLLTETNKSMNEISELTRFSSQSVFSRFFRTHTNMSPNQYRKQAQQV